MYMDRQLEKAFDTYLPLSSGGSVDLRKNRNAALQAVATISGRSTPFDFSLSSSLQIGEKEKTHSFLDSLINNLEGFSIMLGETIPDLPKDHSDLIERAYTIRSYMIKRIQELGKSAFPDPSLSQKYSSQVLYDTEEATRLGEDLKNRLSSVIDVKSLWLYGSAVGDENANPNDLDFRVIVDAPLSCNQYRDVMDLSVLIGQEDFPRTLSVIDFQTLEAMYPLENIFHPGYPAHNFTNDNSHFTSLDISPLGTKAKLVQDMANLHRLHTQLADSGSRERAISLATEYSAVLKARIRNVNNVRTMLGDLGVTLQESEIFVPIDGSIESKLDQTVEAFRRTAREMPLDL